MTWPIGPQSSGGCTIAPPSPPPELDPPPLPLPELPPLDPELELPPPDPLPLPPSDRGLLLELPPDELPELELLALPLLEPDPEPEPLTPEPASAPPQFCGMPSEVDPHPIAAKSTAESAHVDNREKGIMDRFSSTGNSVK